MKTANNYYRMCLYFEMFIYIFIGLILLGVGIYLVRTKSKYTANTTGIITEVFEDGDGKKCKKILTARKSRITESYECTYNVEYNVEGKIYTKQFTEYNLKSKRTEGDSVNIQYNPKNPSDARLDQLSNKLIGVIFIVVAIILFGVGYFSYYMSKTTGGGLLFGNSCMWSIMGGMGGYGGGSNYYIGRNYNASSFTN